MKDDLISRSALVEEMCGLCKEMVGSGNCDARCFVLSAIKEAPAVDAEPAVYGRWCSDGERVFCSVCDKEAIEQEKPCGSTRFLTPRCPYCGARLDGGDADAGK